MLGNKSIGLYRKSSKTGRNGTYTLPHESAAGLGRGSHRPWLLLVSLGGVPLVTALLSAFLRAGFMPASHFLLIVFRDDFR